MVGAEVDIKEYLQPRDVNSLPKRRGRQASTLYALLIEAFVSSGEKAMDVNVAKIGGKPQSARSALVKAIKAGGFQEKVRVSLIGNEVILVLR